MQSIAQGWLMHRLTSSPMMLGLLTFTQFLPVLFLSLWAGVIADRFDKRRLLLLTQSLARLQAVALASIVSRGIVQAWMVLALALLFGIMNAFDLPTRQSIVAEMVAKEDLPNAIALNSAAFNTARVVGPAIAGVLVATIGEAGCFWLNALSYVAVIASLLRIRLPRRERAGGRALASMAEGIRYAWGTGSIRNLLLLLGVASGFGYQYTVLLPVYARDLLHAGAGGYGLMVAAFGLGSLVSAVLMTRRLDRWDLRRHLLIGLSTAAVGMAGFAWARLMPLTLAMGFLAGFGLILYVASTNTLLQLTTADQFRGRVMSLYTLFFVGSAPFGALMVGAVAQRFGAPWATSINAAVLLGGAVWVFYRLRVLAARETHPTTPPVAERIG